MLKCFDPQSNKILYRLDLSNMMKIPYAGTLFETKITMWYASISYEIIRIQYREGISYQSIKTTLLIPHRYPAIYQLLLEDSDHTLW